MDYQKHHDRLIARARARTLEGYKERHHVIPRCMGGDNSLGNLVNLTPEEHYVVHQLLVKLHPSVRGLAHAASRMSRQCTCSKAFGWIRRRMAADNRLHKHTPEVIEKLREQSTGRKHTIASRAKMSQLSIGKKKSPEHVLKIRAASLTRRGIPLSPETRAKMSISRTGLKRPKSPEHRAKISATLTGKKFTEERREKLSAARLGKKKPPRSPEHCAKISANAKRRYEILRQVEAALPLVA